MWMPSTSFWSPLLKKYFFSSFSVQLWVNLAKTLHSIFFSKFPHYFSFGSNIVFYLRFCTTVNGKLMWIFKKEFLLIWVMNEIIYNLEWIQSWSLSTRFLRNMTCICFWIWWSLRMVKISYFYEFDGNLHTSL